MALDRPWHEVHRHVPSTGRVQRQAVPLRQCSNGLIRPVLIPVMIPGVECVDVRVMIPVSSGLILVMILASVQWWVDSNSGVDCGDVIPDNSGVEWVDSGVD